MPFAGYGFNQGHATAYADVSFRSAYLKAHYPAEFLCARLADHGGFHHPAIYMAEAVRLGFAVRPPHVNFSGETFSLTNDEGRMTMEGRSRMPNDSPSSFVGSPSSTLFMGLGQVRDLRHAAIAGILQERERAAFTSVRDLRAAGRSAAQGDRPFDPLRRAGRVGREPGRAAGRGRADQPRQRRTDDLRLSPLPKLPPKPCASAGTGKPSCWAFP